MTEKGDLVYSGKGEKLIQGRFSLRGVQYFAKTKQLSALIYDTTNGSHHHCFRDEIETQPTKEELNQIIHEFIKATI